MIPTYLNSSTSPFPAALSEDHQLQPFNAKPQESSSSSLPTHAFTYSIQDQGGFYHRELHHQEYQQGVNNLASNNGGSNDHLVLDTRESDRGLKLSLWKKEVGDEDQTNPAKWMCSKLRVMRKMMNSNHTSGTAEAPTEVQIRLEDQIERPSSPLETTYRNNSCSTDSNSPIRVCSDCNTTKTPLWRSGPRGPKSLCNACGIRQRKARRAMAAAAAAAAATTEENNASLGAETSPLKIKLQHKAKRSNTSGHVSQYKKRSKLATAKRAHGRKKLCFEDFLVSLSKNLACHQVFPQDEKEAAILLMALSCGLVHG